MVLYGSHIMSLQQLQYKWNMKINSFLKALNNIIVIIKNTWRSISLSSHSFEIILFKYTTSQDKTQNCSPHF